MKTISSAPRATYAGNLLCLPALVLVFSCPLVVSAETPPPANAPQHAFEVATIKRTDIDNTHPASITITPDHFEASGMTLKELIKIAWNLNYGADEQISGGPPWVSSTRFDLDAKEDAALASEISRLPQQQQGEQVRAMLRDLITQRFQLQLHHETRQLAVYELVVAKSGAKLMPAAQPVATQDNGKPERPSRWVRFAGVGELQGYSADMETLVTALCMQPEIGGRLVVDKTGLTGNYDFTLKWTPDIFLNKSSDNSGPSLFTALQEELGLKLDTAKAPVDSLIIDHVSPPSAN